MLTLDRGGLPKARGKKNPCIGDEYHPRIFGDFDDTIII